MSLNYENEANFVSFFGLQLNQHLAGAEVSCSREDCDSRAEEEDTTIPAAGIDWLPYPKDTVARDRVD